MRLIYGNEFVNSEGKIVPLHTLEAYRRSRFTTPLILTLLTIWGWLSALGNNILTSREASPACRWRGDWVGPTTSLSVSEKGKIHSP